MHSMKRLSYLFLSLIVSIILTACKHSSDLEPSVDVPPPPTDTPEPGAVQPVGVPNGAAVIKTIGTAGGVIHSDDDRFTVSIPAGALTSDVAISMQPITNTNGSGLGTAYRMLPDGQKFAKPISIRVNYTDEETRQAMPEALGIAYQNSKGVWMGVGGVELDTAQKSVSIDVNHFTDFSFFEYSYLDPELSIIDPGKSVELHFYTLGLLGLTAKSVPKGTDRELPAPRLVSIDYIDGWELKGAGNLQVSGKNAIYQAPASIPATNPALVTVKLHSPVDQAVGWLIARIYVLPVGISLQVDGGDWITLPSSGANLSHGIKGVDAEKADGASAHLHWQGGSGIRNALGIFNWTLSTITFSYRANPYTLYEHLYGKKPDISGGSLKVDGMLEGYLVGSFDLQPSGLYQTTFPPVIATAPIRGVFRVKCLDCTH